MNEDDENDDLEEVPPQLEDKGDKETAAPDGQDQLDDFLETIQTGPLGQEPQAAQEVTPAEIGDPLEQPQQADPFNVPAPETFVPEVAEPPPDVPGEDIGERAIPDPEPPAPADTLLERLMRESHDRAEDGHDDFADASADEFLKMDMLPSDSGGGGTDMSQALQGLFEADHSLNSGIAEMMADHEQKLNGILRLLESQRL